VVPDYLAPSLGVLRRAYPDRVPDEDYFPLLAVLTEYVSAENLALVVGELTGEDPIVVENDAAATASSRAPRAKEVERVRRYIVACGWDEGAE
jgi:hypothetical protein